MTPQERRKRLQVILDEHDQIAKELRESGEAFRESAGHLNALTARMTDMSAAINKATTAMIAANRAAMALFNDEDQP